MNTQTFLEIIRKHPDKFLRFRDHRDSMVHPSYHVSEVKTAIYQTVDCGNMEHSWKETILQLWISDDPDSERAMQVGKVVQILDKVGPRIAMASGAELMVEHGSDDFPSIVFHVGELKNEGDEVIVFLQPPTTQCKLELRGSSCVRPEGKEGKSESCCSGPENSCC